ncbi:hypothetical protein KR032_010228, partial [Drosophila birchii]
FYKIKELLSAILKSFIADRIFEVAVRDSRSSLAHIHAGVPQGSVLGPFLYTLYTIDMPVSSPTVDARMLLATYADDTALLASH